MAQPGAKLLLKAMLSSALLLAGLRAPADEGMWLYNHPPRELIRERYGFELTDAWLDHLQKASVRFGGASAEFVSEDGLVLSNHHVARVRSRS